MRKGRTLSSMPDGCWKWACRRATKRKRKVGRLPFTLQRHYSGGGIEIHNESGENPHSSGTMSLSSKVNVISFS
jgi:hypothetical protein